MNKATSELMIEGYQRIEINLRSELENREKQIMQLQEELADANEKLRLIAKECWGRRGINPADRLRQIREIVYEYKELP